VTDGAPHDRTLPRLRWGAATDTGRVRGANEDAFVAEERVFGVADGMGGHQAGEVASALAARTLRDRLAAGAATVDLVIAAVVEANAAIFAAAHTNSSQQGMGTTLTALALVPERGDEPTQLALVNVGDSRTYRWRAGALERVTVDHSYVQELVATGHITEAEARTHPRRNIVTRALGIEPTVRVDAWLLPLVSGDRFVLCSDGLVDEVDDDQIAAVVARVEDPQAAADELVAMANEHGGRDNVTVVVVDVLTGVEDGAPAAAPAALTTAVPAVGGEQDLLDERDGVDEPAPDPTAQLPVTAIAAAPPAAGRRRITGGMLLFLVALGLILTLTVVFALVALDDDGDDAPTPTTTRRATTTTEPTTTERPTTTAAPGTTTAVTVGTVATATTGPP